MMREIKARRDGIEKTISLLFPRWRSTPFDLLPWETLLATAILVPLAWVGAGPPAFPWSVPVAAMPGPVWANEDAGGRLGVRPHFS